MAKAVKSTKAEETAQFLLEIGATFGLPSSLRSDNARAPFVNELMAAFLRLVNVERKAAIAYLPRTNGTVERWIAELTKHLRYLVVGAGLKERWSEYLPLAVRILNATRTAGIGCAPAQIVFWQSSAPKPRFGSDTSTHGAGGRTRDHSRSNS
jgi:hypothetical protein